MTGADAGGNSIPVGSGTAAQLVNHVPDRIDHKLRLLGLYVVARVCVEDEPGIQALCQRFLPRDVGFEDDGAEVHRDARWQAALGGEGLQIVGHTADVLIPLQQKRVPVKHAQRSIEPRNSKRRDFRISVAKSIKERIFTAMIEQGLEKVIHNFPHDMQPLFPAIASAA